MQYRSIPVVVVAVALLVCASSGIAGPNVMSYQGVLSDKDGVPLSRSIGLTFSIYSAATGGTALWSETQTVVVSNGVFNVLLGSATPFPLTLFDSDTLYLGVKAGADPEMVPRQRVTSVAFSRRADGSVPIGSVIAWHKSMAGTPPLGAGWVECNGQIISDPESPYNGQTVPNLNGQARTLYGGSVSGSTRMEDSLPAHSHGPGTLKFKTASNWPAAQASQQNYCSGEMCGGTTGSAEAGTPFAAFQVVWIMRVR